MEHSIRIHKKALKTLKKLNRVDRQRIKTRISQLADNPYPADVEKLEPGHFGFFRIRVGNYRFIYEVKDDLLLILVLTVDDRKHVYKTLRRLIGYSNSLMKRI